jgi:hypothetical protein
MKRPYDDADDLQEREMYLRDRGEDHEENTFERGLTYRLIERDGEYFIHGSR